MLGALKVQAGPSASGGPSPSSPDKEEAEDQGGK